MGDLDLAELRRKAEAAMTRSVARGGRRPWVVVGVEPDVMLALLDRLEAAEAASKRWQPAWVVCPGEILQEEITERGTTQAMLAQEIGCSAKHLNQVCRGHVSITAPFALRLEKALGISAELWLGLQAAWDLHYLRSVAVAPMGEPEVTQDGEP